MAGDAEAPKSPDQPGAAAGAPPAPADAPTEPTGPEEAAVSRDPGTPDKAVDDANDMRGFFFRQRVHQRKTWIWTALFAVVLGAGAAFISPALIPVGMVVAVLLALVVVFFMADSESEEAFFKIYTEQRGMTFTEKGSLPSATPLLRKGDERRAKDICEG